MFLRRAVCDEEEMLEVRSLSGETWELAPAAFEALPREPN